MFRFTIRELVLLTLVVAMGLGWALRERKLRADADRANAYRLQANALEFVLTKEGMIVEWNDDRTVVWATRPPSAGATTGYALDVVGFHSGPDPQRR